MKKIVYILMFLAITISANAQWVQMSNTIGTNRTVYCFTVNGTNLFACTNDGVYLSTNNGTNWTAINSGLTSLNVYALAVSGTNIFAGAYGQGVFKTTNNGTNWTQVNTGLTHLYVISLAVSGTNIFAMTDGGIYKSTNSGTNWTQVNSGLTNLNVRTLAFSGTNIFAGTYGSGVYLSTNNGTNWVASGLTNSIVQSLAVSGTNIFAGIYGGGVSFSTNNGISWTAVNNGITNLDVRALAVTGNNLFAGTYGGGVFLSTNNGTIWYQKSHGFTGQQNITTLYITNNYIFAGANSAWRLDLNYPLPEPSQLLSPSDNSIDNPLNLNLVWNKTQYAMLYNVLFASDASFNNTIIDTLLTDTTLAIANLSTFTNYYWKVRVKIISDWGPFSDYFTFRTGSPWIPMYNGLSNGQIVRAFTTIGNNIFAGTQSNGVYKSTDNGLNWISVNNGLSNQNILSLTSYNNFLYAGTSLGGIYQSTNNGDYWVAVSNGLGNNAKVNTLLTKGTSIYAGTASGVYVTTNNGGLWTQSGLTWDTRILFLNGNTIYAGTYLGGLHISTDNGTSWMARNSGLGNMRVLSITVNGNNLFAGTEGGIFLSTNNGLNWTAGWLTNQTIYSLAASNNRIFIGSNIGSLVSFDNGLSWININFGFVSVTNVYSYLINNDHIFAGTNNSVWRHVLSEVIGISTISNHVPKTYSLSQNYPNPFNPSTKIKFDVLRSNIVTLKVFDVLGREIATLVNEQVKPGTYEVDWNASNYPSGVYFYTMRTEGYTETKRMILIK